MFVADELIGAFEIEAAYRLILGREPDAQGRVFYQELARRGMTIGDLRKSFLGSVEFENSSYALSIGKIFNILYKRAASDEEKRAINSFANSVGVENSSDLLRAIVCCFPRADYPTSTMVRFSEENIISVEIKNSTARLCLDKYDWSVSSTVIKTGEYEPHLRRFLDAVIKPGMFCADIGANVGFHTMIMSSLVGEAGHVYAFEPNSENCRMLMLSIEENKFCNIDLIPLALSNKLGAAVFSSAIGSNGGFASHFKNALMHPNCSIVPTAPLDSILFPERLDLVKIDIEGAEHLALEGARRILSTFMPIIVSEYSVDMLSTVSRVSGIEYIKNIMDLGYRAYTLGCSGPLLEIEDLDVLDRFWTDRFRIEDIAFVPRHSSFDFANYVSSG